MDEDRAFETPAVQLAALRTDVKNLKERTEEYREKQDRIYDILLELAGRTKNIERDLSIGNDRFRDHESRIVTLEGWRSTHSGARSALAALWGMVIAVVGAAGIYFAALWHPGGK